MNVLIIGLGSIAKRHIDAIRKCKPGATIFALRSSSDGNDYSGVKNIYWLDKSIIFSFVIISNPTEFHGKTILDCIALNCPLFIEKPVLSNLENSDEIISTIRENETFTYVACNLRFHPAIIFLKSYLKEYEPIINEVNIYCGSYLPDWRPGRDFKFVYSAIADLGGGVHLDLIHELDYCIWLFGYPDNVNVTKSSVSSLGIDAVDYAHYVLSFPKYIATVTLNYFRRDPRRIMEILFDTTTWNVDLLQCIITDSDKKPVFAQNFNILQTYYDQMDYFLNAIDTNEIIMNDINEAIRTLKIGLTNE